MDNSANMLQLCRLCLVKDEVNIPIFEEQGDIRQIFLKISSCLPVKVSREDKLPKKICDGCSCKLDMLYEFWNTSANAEKQLLSWLGEAGMSAKMNDGHMSAVAQQIKPNETLVKEEELDPSDLQKEEDDDDEDDEEKSYMFQQKLEENNAGPSATATSNEEEEQEQPPPKRARRTAAVKAAIAMDHDSDDDDDSGEPLTKVEDESEDSDCEDAEPAFVDAPSTSADDQPGPSGVGKDGADAPSISKKTMNHYVKRYNLKECSVLLSDVKKDKKYSFSNNSFTVQLQVKRIRTYTCYACWETFIYKHDLTKHSNIVHNNVNKSCNLPNAYPKSKKYKCEKCEIDFKSTNALEEHKKSCELKCDFCDLTFNTLKGKKVHLLNHKIRDDPKKENCIFNCEMCSGKFPNVFQLKIHKLENHKDAPIIKTIDSIDDEFTCDLCFDIFKTKKELDEHMEFHKQLQSKVIDTVTMNADSSSDEEPVVNSIPIISSSYSLADQKYEDYTILKPTAKVCIDHYQCNKCERTYLTMNEFEDHLNDLCKVIIMNCSLCSATFKTNVTYYEHFKETHTHKGICEYCFKIIRDKRQYCDHLLQHFKAFKNVCKICVSLFNTYEDFDTHLKDEHLA